MRLTKRANLGARRGAEQTKAGGRERMGIWWGEATWQVVMQIVRDAMDMS